MKTLDRQKLDVVNKTRSNFFGRRGPFTPGLVKESRVQAIQAFKKGGYAKFQFK